MSRGRETTPWHWRFLLGLGKKTSPGLFLPSALFGRDWIPGAGKSPEKGPRRLSSVAARGRREWCQMRVFRGISFLLWAGPILLAPIHGPVFVEGLLWAQQEEQTNKEEGEKVNGARGWMGRAPL